MNSFNQTTPFSLLLIHLHFMLTLLIGSITLLPLSSHGCHEGERRALLNFKLYLADPSNRLSSWQESIKHRNCCDWHGIKCSHGSLHVVSIDLRNTKLEDYINEYDTGEIKLPGTSLEGKLSPSLSNITHLEYLDLAFNDFQASQIPFQFSELTKLIHIDLSNTNLSASISTPFTNLSSLQYLDLSCETISVTSCLESPSTEWMRRLTNLQVLRLSGIDLYEATSSTMYFSDDISYLWNLRYLDISSCNIYVFPIHEFHNLSHLSTLKMNYNSDLSSSIPIKLANLTSLSILHLSSCELLGPVPKEIIHLQQLRILDVSMNNLSGSISMFIQNLSSSVTVIKLGNNNFQGIIPTGIGSLNSLMILSLWSNRLNGSIPEDIIHLQQLQVLDLSMNNLSGPIPEDIIHLQQLRTLDLSMNNLSGPIPKNLGNLLTLTSKTHIFNNNTGNSMQYNQLATEGTTAQFEQFYVHNLKIDLSSNTLHGNIPEELGLLKELVMLNLSNNLLSSNIPASIGNMSNLESLDLSSNWLSGSIPQSLTSIDSLKFVNLSYNKLSGKIPRGNHFDSLGKDGKASFIGNDLLCGIQTWEECEGGQIPVSSTPEQVAVSEGKEVNWNTVLPVLILVAAIIGILGCFYLFKRHKANKRGRLKGLQGALTDLLKSKATYNDNPETNMFDDGKTEGETQELQIFKLACLSLATNNFCLENKLGEGGFGPVYKGKLQNRQEIAVKRLSTNSGQGIEEFKNEVVLISKLQHRNLVKLLGCCVEGQENMLIYEYMPKRSLDAFLFDLRKKTQLDWDKRFNIIGGISRGLLYLHRDSRLRVIHRDLKVSNILLDENMIPKISDFGMARIFGGDQIIANTSRVVGTFGYMSPEYIMGGTFSEKSDVFSFGVLILEIVSGKKNNSFYHPEQPLNLLLHTWRLWNEGKWSEVVDEALGDSYSPSEMTKCIHIGLLCVQNKAIGRPTMAEVDNMLGNETDRPAPKEPPYTFPASSDKSGFQPIQCSNNNVTLTTVEGR